MLSLHVQLSDSQSQNTDPGENSVVVANEGSSKHKNWFLRHKVLSAIIAVLTLFVIVAVATAPSSSTNTSSQATPSSQGGANNTTASSAGTSAPTTSTPTTLPVRQVQGKLVTLGAGQFVGGTDVAVGLYDVRAGQGQSGNFIVQGTDTYDEILGTADGSGIAMIRVSISNGDSIQISGLSQVTFTPVTTPLVTTHTLVNLYAGTWTVGQDIGTGRYVVTPGAGQSGNFIVIAEGIDEILGGSGGVPNVTVNLQSGDIIQIGGLSQVIMTPA